MYRKMPRTSFSTALFGSCVTLPMRPSGKSGAEVHASKSPLKCKKHYSTLAFCMHLKKENNHVHDDDENTSRPRSLDSSPRVAVKLHAARAHGHEPIRAALASAWDCGDYPPNPKGASSLSGGWRSSATPRTAAWLLLERLVEGLVRQCVSRYHI